MTKPSAFHRFWAWLREAEQPAGHWLRMVIPWQALDPRVERIDAYDAAGLHLETVWRPGRGSR